MNERHARVLNERHAPVLNERHALVLFSGGQDSTTCLAWALSKFDRVDSVAFDYGQRHRIELDCRLNVLRELRIPSGCSASARIT